MLWSTRRKLLLVVVRFNSASFASSAAKQMAAIWRTVSSGYLPAAVSALSITASVPSSTAFATSLTSARVGTGAKIMDSIIWVAVIATLSNSWAMRIMRFCKAGTAALPTSTAKSPRATMMPSLAFKILAKWGIASARSILAIKLALCLNGSPATLHNWRASSMSVALCGKLTAT